MWPEYPNCAQIDKMIGSAQQSEWVQNMPNEFWSAIVGAIVGSIVAGVIAYLIQRQALKASAKQHEKETKEKQRALGHALLFKMMRIHTNLGVMRMHLEECLGRLETEEHAGWEPWQVVLPIANHAEVVHFSTDEMAMLLSLKDNNLLNDLASLDVIHNSTIDLFRTHASHRAALLERLIPENMDGMVGEIVLTKEQVMYVRPKMVELNALIISMNGRCGQDADQAGDILQRLTTTLNEKLELGVSVIPIETKA